MVRATCMLYRGREPKQHQQHTHKSIHEHVHTAKSQGFVEKGQEWREKWSILESTRDQIPPKWSAIGHFLNMHNDQLHVTPAGQNGRSKTCKY